MSSYRRFFSELAPVAILILVVLLFFAKAILAGAPLFGSDFVLQFYPWKAFLYEHVRSEGTLPFWNPYLFSGTPFLANIQVSMFYPLDFLFYMVPTEYAYGYTVILHFILASVFMYVFVRSLSVSKMGAMLSAAIFTFNGFLMAHLYAGHLTLIHSYIWIPIVFLFLHRFLYSALPKYSILAGFFLGLQILGGFPQVGFYTIFGALLYTLYFVFLGPQRINGKHVAWAAFGMGVILVIGFGLAALQLLPTYEFMQLSTRAGGTSYEFATIDSFPPRNFMTFLIPDLFGVPGNNTYWISDATWTFWEYCGYASVCGLLLIVVAIRKIVADREGMFFVLLILITLFLSLGKHNPLYRFIYYLPGFHHFRIPAQILFLYVFAVAVLAGMGLNHLTEKTVFSGTPRIVVLAGLSLLLVLAVWSHVHPYSFFYVFFKLAKPTGFTGDHIGQVHAVVTGAVLKSTGIFLVIVVLFLLYRKGLPSYATTGSLLILIALVDMGSFAFPLVRTVHLEPSPNQAYLTQQLNLDHDIYRAMVNNGCFPENAGLRHGFQDIQGYDPLILKRYVEYVNRSQQVPPDNKVVNMHYIRSVDNPLINMLNLKYIVDCQSNTITKRTAFFPRAFIVHEALVKAESEVLDYMMGEEFDPMKMVVFSNAAGVPKATPPPDGEKDQEMCSIVSYDADEITVDAKLNSPGFLVMSEIDYPGWQAYVDGKMTPVLTANYLFRTVSLEPGRHHIRFLFNPFSFKAGTVVSFVSVVGIVVGLIILSRKRKQA
jgi:hypothetical protein